MKKRDDGSGMIGVVPGFLRPIDTDQIAKNLKPAEQGEKNGKQNIPRSETESFDDVEQTIVQKLESEWSWQGGELLNHLRSYAVRLSGYSIEAEFTRLQLQAKAAITNLRAISHQAEAELGPLREHFLAARQELKEFKTRHNLSRPSRAPSNRWTSFGLLFVLLAVESGLNGIFFAKGSDYGLIGGIGTAIGISLVNIVFAFSLGIGPARWTKHNNYLLKVIGSCTLIAGLALLIAIHGFAAHLREATASAIDEDEAARTAWQTLLHNPLSLHDLNSVYLFALGMLFALLAVYKGYTFDDPFPGYGSVTRRFARARDAYIDEHALLFEDLEETRGEVISSLTEGIQRIPTFPQAAANIRAQRTTMLEQFRAYESGVEAAVRQLLAKYRQANIAARTSNPPPHFDHNWHLPYSFLTKSEVVVSLSEAKQQPTDSSRALAELKRLSDAISGEYETLIKAYPHPTQMTES